VKTATTVAYEIFRYIRREAATFKEPILVINCSADVARLLQGKERQELRHLMDRFNKSIQVKAQQNYHPEQFDVYGKALQSSEMKETPFDARANASTEAVHAKSERP